MYFGPQDNIRLQILLDQLSGSSLSPEDRELLERLRSLADRCAQINDNTLILKSPDAEPPTDTSLPQKKEPPAATVRPQSLRYSNSNRISPEAIKVIYEQVTPLGHGGMGDVWRVLDPSLERTLAMKILHERDPEIQEQFQNEAKIMARLQHPGIIPIHDMGVLKDGRPYFTMKEVDGQTFKSLILKSHKSMETSGFPRKHIKRQRHQMVKIFHQICETIAYAHANGVIHLDLKPANVMVGNFGAVFVMDWGIAEEYMEPRERRFQDDPLLNEQATLTNRPLMGTPAFMAPEQIKQEEKLGPRTDVYALGGLLYFILTGKAPYSGEIKSILNRKIKFNPSPPNTEFRNTLDAAGASGINLSEEVENICMKALHLDPTQRYPNARAMMDVISRWLAGEEQTEKGRMVLNKVHILKKEQKEIRAKLEQARSDFNLMLMDDGPLAPDLWKCWSQIEELRLKKTSLHHRIEQQLNNALLTDPDQTPAYLDLIALEYPAFIDALMCANTRISERIETKFQLLIGHLSGPLQMHWRRRINDVQKYLGPIQNNRLIIYGRGNVLVKGMKTLKSERRLWVQGPTGAGKSHFVLQLAKAWLLKAEGRLLFCDLSGCETLTDVMGVIAKSLEVSPGQLPEETVQLSLKKAGRTLLILDNCHFDHQGLHETSDRLIKVVDNLEIILTNAPTHKSDKHTITLAPLCPEEAFTHFVACGSAIHSGALVNKESIGHIKSIIQLLEGNPYNIELAAARLKSMNAAQLSTRLRQTRNLLDDTLSSLNLTHSLEWYWKMLPPDHQFALRQCATFPSAFDLEAAEAILSNEDQSSGHSIATILNNLISEHFILTSKLSNNRIVYSVSNAVAQFLKNKHPLSSEELQLFYISHARYFAGLHRHIREDKPYISAKFKHLIESLKQLEMATANGPIEEASLCYQSAWFVQRRIAHFDKASQISMQFLKRKGLSKSEKIRIEAQGIYSLHMLNKSLDLHSRMTELLEQSTTPELLPNAKYRVHLYLGIMKYEHHQIDEAEVQINAGLLLCKSDGLKTHLAAHIFMLGQIARNRGKNKEAMALYKQSEEVMKKYDAFTLDGLLQLNIGHLYFSECNLQKAESIFAEAAEVNRRKENINNYIASLISQANVLNSLGKYEESIAIFNQCLALQSSNARKSVRGMLYAHRGRAKVRMKLWDDARKDFEKANTFFEVVNYTLGFGYVNFYRGIMYQLTNEYKKSLREFEHAIKNLIQSQPLMRLELQSQYWKSVALCGETEAAIRFHIELPFDDYPPHIKAQLHMNLIEIVLLNGNQKTALDLLKKVELYQSQMHQPFTGFVRQQFLEINKRLVL